jgi:hypothetical protein
MSALPMAGKQPSVGYLCVQTEELRKPSPVGRLPTPMSSRGDERRPSLGWSFMTGTGPHPSQPSSVASFQSSHEPQTPPQHTLLLEFSLAHPNGSFESFSVPSQCGEGKLAFQDGQMMQTSMLNTHEPFGSQTELNWTYVQRSSGSTQARLPFCAADSMIPASGDFPSALLARMHHPTNVTTDQQELDGFQYPNAWNSQQPGTSYRTDGGFSVAAANQNSSSDSTVPFEWVQSIRPMMMSRTSVDASTIVPSAVVRDEDVLSQGSRLHGYQETNSEILSQCGEYYTLDHDDHYKSEPCQSDHDETWVPGSSMMESAAKDVKKDKRALAKDRRSAGGGRRSRMPKTTVFSTRFNNREVDIHVQQPRNGKKHTCRYILEDGQLCARAFERVEHLRRHEQIHQPMRPFICPLHTRPDLGCNKLFGRRDNWRDHLRTHLSSTIAGRNDRISFEDLFALLRESEEHEEAEKTINMLLKWKAKGGHEKSTSLPVRGSRA